MDKTKIALLTTLILGLFIIIGALIALIVNKKQKVLSILHRPLPFEIVIKIG